MQCDYHCLKQQPKCIIIGKNSAKKLNIQINSCVFSVFNYLMLKVGLEGHRRDAACHVSKYNFASQNIALHPQTTIFNETHLHTCPKFTKFACYNFISVWILTRYRS